MSVYEAGMIVCFGIAWPVSIYKLYVSKSTGGVSEVFIWIVFLGYISGLLHKIVYNFDLVIIAYFLNLVMVIIAIILFYRNRRIEKRNSDNKTN
jgi:lipopolysaccharide export LptBFGC system permease protein LptF